MSPLPGARKVLLSVLMPECKSVLRSETMVERTKSGRIRLPLRAALSGKDSGANLAAVLLAGGGAVYALPAARPGRGDQEKEAARAAQSDASPSLADQAELSL